MTGDGEPGARVVECGTAGAALERESGDVHVIAGFPHGVLVAVIDGLGHGTEAAVAANEAARILSAGAGGQLVDLVAECHEALRKTRGAALSVASFDARTSAMTWLGVGNVEGILLRADPAAAPSRENVPLRGGVVGYQLPALRPASLPVSRGDTLVLATDGIRSAFVADLAGRGGAAALRSSPQEVADSVLARHGRGSDDALVLVARWLEGGP